MAENVKLKDLYADEKVYDGINTVKIPKADGTGNANFIVPPTSMYMLKKSSYSAATENNVYAYSGIEMESDFTGFGDMVRKELYPSALPIPVVTNYTFGKNNIYCHPLENMTITELMNRLIRAFSDDNVTVTPDTYSVTPGWFHIKYTQTGDGANLQVTITEFEEVTDPSTVTFPAYLPWKIFDANYFYSYIAEATQQMKTVTVTENGTQTINPDAGKSGLASVSLNVNVPSSGGKLQEKSVSITSNGTTEVTPDAGYDGISKLTATVNVAGGGSDDYYLLKNPLGEMPTYPDSSKIFLHTDAVIASGFKPYIYTISNSNANEAYGIPVTTMVNFHFKEPTADIYANSIMFINSASAATLSQEVLQMFLGSSWTFGAMTLAVGWNVCTFTVNDSGTTTAATCTATTIDAINMTLQGYGGIPKNNFDWAAMDAYTLSFFKDAAEPAGADAKSWVFTNGVASISQADFNRYLAPGVVASIFINVPLEPVGGTGYSQMQNVMRSASGEFGDGSAQLVFAGEEYSLDETADPKILTPTVGGFGIISRASADADFVLSYVNAYGNTITPAFTSNGVQVTLYAQLLQL